MLLQGVNELMHRSGEASSLKESSMLNDATISSESQVLNSVFFSRDCSLACACVPNTFSDLLACAVMAKKTTYFKINVLCYRYVIKINGDLFTVLYPGISSHLLLPKQQVSSKPTLYKHKQ